jgi:hypothetical protein
MKMPVPDKWTGIEELHGHTNFQAKLYLSEAMVLAMMTSTRRFC